MSSANEGYQGDLLPPPPWLNEELLQQALRNGGEENPVIASFSVRRAVAPGENYISTVYRVLVTLSNGKERSFVIKGPAEGGMSEMTDICLFEREIDMLTDYIPKMEALLEAKAPGRFPAMASRCYHHSTSPVEFIVMEDLSHAGFKMADRKLGLDLKHCLLAFRYLARFHAASHALLRRQPELTEKLYYTWKPDNQGLLDYFNGELQATAVACRTWPGFDEIADRLEKFKSISGATFHKVNKPTPGAFNVITHGDFWVNNMMFRYEDGNPVELKAVDLQLSHTTSPAIDILHFFSNSLNEEVDVHHRPLLLKEYHFHLKEAMELLGLEAPSLEALLQAMDAHGAYGVIMGLEIPIVKADHNVDFDAICSGHYAAFLRMLEAPHVKPQVQRKLREYASKGWLPA